MTFFPEAQIKSQSEWKLIFCLPLIHTYILILIYALTLNYLESKCCWETSVRGASVVLP